MGRDFAAGLWHPGLFTLGLDSTLAWAHVRFGRVAALALTRYAAFVLVPAFRLSSVLGFALLTAIGIQVVSGFYLALFFVPDPTFVMTVRAELQNEVPWFFGVHRGHVTGVDCVFTLSYLHLLKKVYLKNYAAADVDGWVTGVYAFMIFHAVVFFGITLTTNHLGDLTLTIGANIMWSLFLFKHKAYALVFGNRHLSVDILVRFMVFHYVLAWFYCYLLALHTMYIHECWDADSDISAPQESGEPKGGWLHDALERESGTMVLAYVGMASAFWLMAHPEMRPVNFNFFEHWAEVEVEDINFFVVGPHWYFRPHMGLLTLCAQHYEGLFWLAAYYVGLLLLPFLAQVAAPTRTRRVTYADYGARRNSMTSALPFAAFVGCMVYVGGTLPCARFFYDGEEGFGGNSWLRVSYQYIYAYLAVVLHWQERWERWVVAVVDAYRVWREWRHVPQGRARRRALRGT